MRMKRKFLFLLALLLIAAGSAWADSESIWTNTKQSSYTSGNITIAVDAVGDGDGAYVNTDKMVISTSDGGNITQVVLRIGYYVTSASYVTANHGSCEVSGTGNNKETYVTITSINAPSVTVTSTETVQVDHVDVTYSPFIAVTGVSLSSTSAVLIAGQTTTLTATVAPASATNKNVTWSTSNSSVATVSNGVVTAKGMGTATITATTENGGYTATCAVTVDDPVTVAKYVGKVIAADGKVYKTLAAANKYSTARGIVAYYGSEVVETGQTYKAIAISLTNSERTNMYCGLDNTSCSGSTYSDIATALTVKNGIATTAATLETNVAHGYSHQLYYAAHEDYGPLPAGASTWSIPSIGQWNLIIKGLTGSGTNLSTSANGEFSASNVNAKIPTGADGFSELNYWSCTEKDNNKMWMMQFNGSGGLANNINKKNYATQGFRTMFAFTSATPVYIINYDANGGSGAPDEQVKNDGSNLTLSSTVPTREGYTFAGWNTAADGSGTSYAAGGTYTTDDDATLYAQWLLTTMIGCEGKIIAADGKMYKTLAAANKYSTASGIVAYYGSAVETGQPYRAIAISLSNSDVTNMYCGNNGSTCSGHTYSDIATAITIKDGIATTAATLETNVAHGYSHQLYYAAIGTTPSQRPAGASAWSIPSIGQWNMIMRGLTGSNGNLSESANEAFSLSNVNAKIPTGVDGFKEIKYWSCTERDNTNMWMMQFDGSGGLAGYTNKTNYGTDTWCLRTMFAFTSATSAYVVNYDANGGSGAPDEQLKDGGSSLTLSSTVPTREGYTFAGWNTAADGSGTAYEAGAEYTTEDDATLYAQWTEKKTKILDEAATDNLAWLTENDGQVYDVTLTRTLQTGGWNTFCAPFSTATPSGWTVKELTGSAFNSTTGELTLTFGDAENGIEAGKPYLVKVDANVVNPTFSGVTISSTTTTTEKTAVDFVPVMNPTSLTGGDKTVLFVTGGNKLTYPTADGNINAFRAYFQLKGDAVAEARAFRMSFDDETTGIVTVLTDEPTTATGIYTLDGRRIEGQPTGKGMYIVNGKKTIIK